MKRTKISSKIKGIGLLLSLMIFSIIALTVSMNEKSKKDSLIINIAGKERMLTQKMSKELFFLRHRDGHDFRALDAAKNLFKNNLNDLRFGNKDRGIYGPQNSVIKKKLDEVATRWKPFEEEIERIKHGILSVKSEKEILSRRIENLLNMSDLIVKEMVKRDLQAIYIDLSGRQRMLTQRMGLSIERYLRTDNQEDFLLFSAAKTKYDETLRLFVNDSELKKDTELHALLKISLEKWEDFEKYILKLLEVEDSINQSIEYINQSNVKILDAMDEAVWLYTEHSERKNQLFLNFLYLAAALALVIILYAFTIARDIGKNINSFVEQAKRLANSEDAAAEKVEIKEEMEAELQEASSYLQTYINKVSSAMNNSEDAVKRAERAIGELQALSEDIEGVIIDLKLDEATRRQLDQSVNQTEDIAIESSENLLHVTKMLKKLKENLSSITKAINFENGSDSQEK
ncbi:MAG: type IV pili methyl-accepting chemotaxis transducer N-terminal domain-containing protein [Sulfurospirillaceae bacterium]|nr:type IV pili methyl-accepting chemotaxis transducer N-terminal domain-containing protein [Sulfurospirillaceae bacterium]